MKKIFSLTNIFVAVMLAVSATGFTACSDDENGGLILHPSMVYGEYSGTMTSFAADSTQASEGLTDSLSASVRNDSICFDNFPVRNIILSVMGSEEIADNITAILGPVSYKIAYKPVVAASLEGFFLSFTAEPLTLFLPIPSDDASNPLYLPILVEIEANNIGSFEFFSGKLAFDITATHVYLGNTEDKTEVMNFPPTTFSFDLNQQRAE